MKHWRRKHDEPKDDSQILYEKAWKTPEVIAPVPSAPTTTAEDYRHMFAWFEMLDTADYARKAYFKQAVEAKAPVESIYPIYTVRAEDDNRVKFTGKWMQYKDLRSKHMSDGIEKIFTEKGWGTP